MVTIQPTNNNRIGIVGGGKIGLSMLDLFCNSQIATVSFVVDVNNSAPAIIAARGKGIPTFTAIDQALSRPVDFILEVTGSQKVIESIQRVIVGKNIQLITHQMAYIILEALEDNASKNRKEVIRDFEGIKDEITKSSDGIGSLLDKINSTTREMNILALNARIEAARAGEHGRGFAVVAQQMALSTESVQRISQEIHQVNDSINSTSNTIDNTLQKLH
jgi:methyl-accepting chemotaxis protein